MVELSRANQIQATDQYDGIVYCAHSSDTIFMSNLIVRFVLSKGHIPVDPFLILSPENLDAFEMTKKSRIELDILVMGKCDYLWVFGATSEGVIAEMNWWTYNNKGRNPIRYWEWHWVLSSVLGEEL